MIGFFKFTGGAWFIMLLVPIMVFLLVRLNHAYESEKEELEHEAAKAAGAPILRYHSVIVLIERLDQSSARAIQYARTLTPDDLKAVHIATDHEKADVLADEWTRLGLSRLPLELVDCPDRRITRAVLEVVAEAASTGNTEVSVLIPRREYRRFWHRFLHDHTADSIAKVLTDVPHANVTFVPYHLGKHTPGARLAAEVLEPPAATRSTCSPIPESPPAGPGGRPMTLTAPTPTVTGTAVDPPRVARRRCSPSATSAGVSGCGCGARSGPCGCSRGRAASPRSSARSSTTPAAWSSSSWAGVASAA